jgi:DNA gyrase/topoisomerase IV subunit A
MTPAPTSVARWSGQTEAVEETKSVGESENASFLDGILDALVRMSQINGVVHGSEDRTAARTKLRSEPFGCSEVVASHVLDLSVGRQTEIGREELRRERSCLTDST